MTSDNEQTTVDSTVVAPVKRGKGRPKGSKNKPKAPKVAEAPAAVVTETKTVVPNTQAFVASDSE